MRQTLQERIARFLIQHKNLTELKSPSSKFRRFSHSEEVRYYWIDKNGSVRAGSSLSSSVSLTTLIQGMMKAWETANDK